MRLFVSSRALIVVAAALAAACERPQPPGDPGPPAVAVVNGLNVPDDALQRDLDRLKRESGATAVRTEEELAGIRRDLLEDRINRALLLSVAREHDVVVGADEVERAILRMRADYPGRTFEEHLAQDGIPMSQLKEEVAERLTIQEILEQEVRARVAVTDAEVQAWYEAHPEKFEIPEEVHARQIVLHTREEAERIRDELKKRGGPELEALARKHSIAPEAAKGGDLGWFPKGVMPPPFDDVCFSLVPGRISDIVESPYGYHLFQVVDKRKARTRPLEEVRGEIETKLRLEKEQGAQDRYLEHLRETADISVDEKVLSEIR